MPTNGLAKFFQLLKEYLAFNSLLLKLVAIVAPVAIYKFVFPDSYYETRYSLLFDFCLYFILPLLFLNMLWKFIKVKKSNSPKNG